MFLSVKWVSLLCDATNYPTNDVRNIVNFIKLNKILKNGTLFTSFQTCQFDRVGASRLNEDDDQGEDQESEEPDRECHRWSENKWKLFSSAVKMHKIVAKVFLCAVEMHSFLSFRFEI